MIDELECVVWCPKCREPRYEVRRKQVREGVYVHERVAQGGALPEDPKRCGCGALLERTETTDG